MEEKNQQRKRILLVEDELFIHDLYKRVLEQSGFEVESAYDGKVGWQLAQQKPDLVLLDIMLPEINGIELLKMLKDNESTKDIPVVLLTNLGQAEVVKNAFKIGAQGYFLKMKLSLQDLIKNVNLFLQNPKMKMDYQTLDLD